MTFLPKGYKPPVQAGNYTKLQDGENTLRVLSSAITGYVYWNVENKPVRSKDVPTDMLDARVNDDGQKEKAKHFWAFSVWNHEAKQVQVMEVTQVSIRDGILALVNNDKWGDPKDYDITITKTGERLETRYGIVPNPKEELTDEIKKEVESVKVNLEALYVGEDPFASLDGPSEDFDTD